MEIAEHEDKFLIDPKDAPWLFQGCRIVNRLEYLTCYYDYCWRLAERDMTFRLRLETGKTPLVCLKETVGWKDAHREAKEYALPVPRRLPRVLVPSEVPGSLGTYLTSAVGDLPELRRVGWTRTVRHVISVDGTSVVELDQTRYPDGSEDLEAEVEDQMARRDAIINFIRTRAPSAKPAWGSKYRRFHRIVSQMR